MRIRELPLLRVGDALLVARRENRLGRDAVDANIVGARLGGDVLGQELMPALAAA